MPWGLADAVNAAVDAAMDAAVDTVMDTAGKPVQGCSMAPVIE
jgi:hypothetical protein